MKCSEEELTEARRQLDSTLHKLRETVKACFVSQRVRIGEWIFRQSRREAEEILYVF